MTGEEGPNKAAAAFKQQLMQQIIGEIVPYINDLHQRLNSVEERNADHDTLRRWNDDYGTNGGDTQCGKALSFFADKLRGELEAGGEQNIPAAMQKQLLSFIRRSYDEGKDPLKSLIFMAGQLGFTGKNAAGAEPDSAISGEGGRSGEDSAAAEAILRSRGKTAGAYRGGIRLENFDDLSAADRRRLQREQPDVYARMIQQKRQD